MNVVGKVGPGGRWGLIALNMGGPDRPEAIEPFLRNLLADRDMIRLPLPLKPLQGTFARLIAKRRAGVVRVNYEHLGGASPLLDFTWKQARAIAAILCELGVDTTPFVAMRYWHPFANEVAREIASAKLDGLIVLSLYPQFSYATSGSSLKDMTVALARAGLGAMPVVSIDRFPTLPGYIDATAASIVRAVEAIGGPAPHVLFSAHGLPQKYVDSGDPYRKEIELSYRAMVGRLPRHLECSLSFQSRVGPQQWLKPYTDAHVRELAARGVKRLLMIPLAFVSDHVETLSEMDVDYGGLARSLGMEFHRAPALNDDPTFMRALAELAFARWSEREPHPIERTGGRVRA